MKFPKIAQFIRQFSTYVLVSVVGVILTVGTLQMLPSQSSTTSTPSPAAQNIADYSVSKTSAALDTNFVKPIVNQVAPAVLQIDTERALTTNLPEESLQNVNFGYYSFGGSFPNNFRFRPRYNLTRYQAHRDFRFRPRRNLARYQAHRGFFRNHFPFRQGFNFQTVGFRGTFRQ